MVGYNGIDALGMLESMPVNHILTESMQGFLERLGLTEEEWKIRGEFSLERNRDLLYLMSIGNGYSQERLHSMVYLTERELKDHDTHLGRRIDEPHLKELDEKLRGIRGLGGGLVYRVNSFRGYPSDSLLNSDVQHLVNHERVRRVDLNGTTFQQRFYVSKTGKRRLKIFNSRENFRNKLNDVERGLAKGIEKQWKCYLTRDSHDVISEASKEFKQENPIDPNDLSIIRKALL